MSSHTPPVCLSPSPSPLRARFDQFELDEANASLLWDGKPVPLAPRPFSVLCALLRQPGTLLTKHALLDAVWGHRFVSDSVLKTAIAKLRAVLEDDPRQPRLIETVSRKGYRFIASATAAAASTPTTQSCPARDKAFIGRADALARLGSAWGVACTGKRMFVWLAGEPGIGKSALIDHFVAHLGKVGCARGHCVEQYGGGEPYHAVLEALAELCRNDPAVASLLRGVAPTWLLRLPWLVTAEEREDPRRELAGVSPERMLREMGEVLDRYTEHQPLLLVTEDLHWSDRPTIQLIDYMARRRGRGRLLWLASFRLPEVVALDHPLNSLRNELRLHGLCEEVVLDPFSKREVADYVATRSAPMASDEAFVRALHDRTDGVPLFVASVMGNLLAQGGDADRVVARLARAAVPENLAGLIDQYIAKLGHDHRALLFAAAVCGVEFRVSTVAEALERDAAWVGETCDDLARARLWLVARRAADGRKASELRYSFSHALFRQVLYERIAPLTRARLHGKVGAALERELAAGTPVAVDELATHFERGRKPMAALG
jgi:DNA-binding winged helix-turn-helix (wHTH) protein